MQQRGNLCAVIKHYINYCSVAAHKSHQKRDATMRLCYLVCRALVMGWPKLTIRNEQNHSAVAVRYNRQYIQLKKADKLTACSTAKRHLSYITTSMSKRNFTVLAL